MGNIEAGHVDSLTFDDLYSSLSRAWESHQQLRMNGAPITRLADSAIDLEHHRDAMWQWWSLNRREVLR